MSDDEVFVLGERCAATYMRADSLHYEAMVLLADFDERHGWRTTGFGSTAEWLAWRIGIRPGAARERVRTARALRHLPLASRALRDGEVSFTKIRALTRVARPECEAALLELARSCSAARLERKLRSWTTGPAGKEATEEARRHRSRAFSVFPDDDGMYVVRGRLDPEVGAALMRAVEAATDVLYAPTRSGGAGEGTPPAGSLTLGEADDDATPEQRRADAVGLMAERALAAGFADGPISGSRGERYQVLLHVEREEPAAADPSGDVSAETSESGHPTGPSETLRTTLGDGLRVSAETSRRLTCDASVVRVHRDGRSGTVLDVGRRKRSVPPALRRALEVRDRGCRFPACCSPFTDAHHIEHWADGGSTRLENLVLLCRRHHRAVHEGNVRVCRGADESVVFYLPDGRVLQDAPRVPAPRSVEPPPPTEARLTVEPRGARAWAPRLDRPSWRTGAARWARDADVPIRIEAEALRELERACGW